MPLPFGLRNFTMGMCVGPGARISRMKKKLGSPQNMVWVEFTLLNWFASRLILNTRRIWEGHWKERCLTWWATLRGCLMIQWTWLRGTLYHWGWQVNLEARKNSDVWSKQCGLSVLPRSCGTMRILVIQKSTSQKKPFLFWLECEFVVQLFWIRTYVILCQVNSKHIFHHPPKTPVISFHPVHWGNLDSWHHQATAQRCAPFSCTFTGVWDSDGFSLSWILDWNHLLITVLNIEAWITQITTWEIHSTLMCWVRVLQLPRGPIPEERQFPCGVPQSISEWTLNIVVKLMSCSISKKTS